MSKAKEKQKTPTGTAPNIIRKSEILTQAGEVRVRSNVSPKNNRPQQVYNGENGEQFTDSPIKKRQKALISKNHDEESRSLPAMNMQNLNSPPANGHHLNLQPLPTIKRNDSCKSGSQISLHGNMLQQQAKEIKKMSKIKNKQNLQQQAVEKVMLLEQHQKIKKNAQGSRHSKNQKSLSLVEQISKNQFQKQRNGLEFEQQHYVQSLGKREYQDLQYNGQQHQQPINLQLGFLNNQEKITSTPSTSHKKKLLQHNDQDQQRISLQRTSMNQQTEYGQFESKLRSPQTYKVNITNITNNNVPYIPEQWLAQASIDQQNVFTSFDKSTNSTRKYTAMEDHGLTTNLRKANQLTGIRNIRNYNASQNNKKTGNVMSITALANFETPVSFCEPCTQSIFN